MAGIDAFVVVVVVVVVVAVVVLTSTSLGDDLGDLRP